MTLTAAVRRILGRPASSAMTVAVLGLAIAATATVIAIADAVLFKPLSVPDAERVVVISEIHIIDGNHLEQSYANYRYWLDNNRSFDNLSVITSVNWPQRLTMAGEPMDVAVAPVSASFFTVMRTPAYAGRVLQEGDDRKGAPAVAVISHALWQRVFGGADLMVGRSVALDGKSYEIVGIMPRQFDYPRNADLWTAIVPELDARRAEFELDALEERGFRMLFAIGRLRAAVTREEVRRDLEMANATIDRGLEHSMPRYVDTTPLPEHLIGRARTAVLLLVAAAALIVAIAIANVATLFLARAETKLLETAVRVAMGASRRQVFQAQLLETLLLFGTAAGLGLATAAGLLPLASAMAADSVYRITDARLSLASVTAVAIVVAAGAVGVTSFATALIAAKPAMLGTLRGAATGTGLVNIVRARRLLVVVECALGVALAVFAGLAIRSFANVRGIELGFDPSRVVTVDVAPSPTLAGAENARFYAPLLARLAEFPEFEKVAAIYQRPLVFDGVGMDARALPDGHAADDTAAWRTAGVTMNREVVSSAYFDVMRIPIVEGRAFTEQDSEASEPAAIISVTAARRLFGTRTAVGRRLLCDLGPDGQPRWRTVVGVVEDVTYRGLADIRPDLYLPYRQHADPVKHFVTRTTADPSQILARVKSEARQLDSQVLVNGAMPLSTVVDRATGVWRLHMALFTALGIIALALAGFGIYAALLHSVAERRRELGVRAAVGASPMQLARAIARECAVLLAVGLGAGLAIALPAGRLALDVLHDVSPHDPAVVASAMAVVIALASAGAYAPARLAARTDPVVLIRST